MVTSKHNSKPNVASGRSPTPSGLIGSERYAFWNFLPTLSYSSFAYMLIVVAILLALAIVYKHVAKPSWIPSSQQLSEKFRLYMAGSMVGDFTRWIFDDWDIWRSRQDTVVVSNRDEKSKRLSLDMSSSSSTSLSPSVLPTHDASPRYKKTSNFRLTSHRRSSSRQKTQTQNILASSLSPIEDNPFLTSSSNDSHSEQSSILTEQDEAKTSVTIHVAETLNSRADPSSVNTCQESKGDIDKIGNNYNQKSSNTVEHTSGKLEADQHLIQDENTDSWTESQQTPTAISNRYDKNRRLTSDLTFSESSISPTSNGSSKLQKKNSLKGNRKQNARNKEQNVVLATQESDGEIDSIISDDHSDSLIQQINTTAPTTQKHEQDSIQEETFIKTGHKRRRRRTRGSKNNQQKTQQNQQTQNLDQRSSKQDQPISLQKQDISQQCASDASKLRNVSGKIKSKSYYFFHNALHDQNTYSKQHHLNEISKSHQVVEKSKTDDYDIWEKHPHQRSDQTVYFLQANKRSSYIYHSTNLNGTVIPAKVTLPESNKKVAAFPRTDIHWKPNEVSSSHAPMASQNFNPTSSTSSVPISRSSYAEVIAPHNRQSALSRSNTSGLSNGNNITTPVPAASMNNTTNHQWYSPFGSGLSIQLTPPASPQNIHRQLPSTNSNTSNSKQFQERNRNVIAPPPSLSASNNVPSFSSSSSMFTSSSFSSLSDSLSNQNQSNIITLPTNSLFRESLFGRKHPVQDQEKGELSDEVDDSESWNKIIGISELTNQRTWARQSNDVRKGKFGEVAKNKKINENAWHREQEPQQQFSLFQSFIYTPKP